MSLVENIRSKAGEMLDEALTLLRTLTDCDTTDGNEINGQERLEAYLAAMPCELTQVQVDPDKLAKYKEFNQGHDYKDRYCVVARFKGQGGGRSLILNAHMDTVPPASPELWKTQPQQSVDAGDRVYALGVADDKGGMVAMLMAIKLLERLGVKLKGDIIFQSVVGEEADGGNGTLAVIDAGYRADAALVAEPTLLSPASAQTGSYATYLTIEGKSAHGNMKHLGVSAFEKALPLINRLSALEKEWSKRTFPLLNKPYLTVLEIKAGDGGITLPSTCRILVNYTYHPDAYDSIGDLMRLIRETEAEDEWFKEHPIRIELHHDCGPYYTDPSTDWPQAVADSLQDALGERPEITGLPTGADSRLYANIANMPCVVLGPGSILDCHNPNEFLTKDQLIKAIAAYACILSRWCGVC